MVLNMRKNGFLRGSKEALGLYYVVFVDPLSADPTEITPSLTDYATRHGIIIGQAAIMCVCLTYVVMAYIVMAYIVMA